MKIALVADVHIGNHKKFFGTDKASINTRCQITLDTLDYALDAALRAKCCAFYVLGDLFDTSKPEPQILKATQEIFAKYKEQMNIYLLIGNHDMRSQLVGDHALGPLSPCIKGVIETPTSHIYESVELISVPFKTGSATDWLTAGIASLYRSNPSETRILLTHTGIVIGRTPFWLKKSKNAIVYDTFTEVLNKYKISFMFAGDWHFRMQEDKAMQVGALCPTGFDNPGLYDNGTLVILNTNPVGFDIQDVPGPRFVVVKSLNVREEILQELVETGYSVFLKLAVPTAVHDEARTVVDSLIKRKLIVNGEVDTSKEIEVEEARLARTDLRAVNTIPEQISAYVSMMHVNPMVKKENVIARVTEYLK